MKWFKHFSDSNTNLKLQIIIREFGMEGYGFFWFLLEIVAQQGEGFRISRGKEWKTSLAISSNFGQEKTEKILKRFSDLNLIDKKALSRGNLYLPKMQKYADEYTEKVGRVSRHCRDNVPLEEEQKKKKKKNRTEGEEDAKKIFRVPSVSKIFQKFQTLSPSLEESNEPEALACLKLIEKYGEAEAENMAEIAVLVQGMKYAPKITTPKALWERLADLQVYLKRERQGGLISV